MLSHAQSYRSVVQQKELVSNWMMGEQRRGIQVTQLIGTGMISTHHRGVAALRHGICTGCFTLSGHTRRYRDFRREAGRLL